MKRAVAIAAVLVGSAMLAPSPAAASKTQWSIFEDHTALVQSNLRKRVDTLEKIKSLGVDTLRIEFRWHEIAPSPKSKSKPTFDAANPAAYQGSFNGYPGFGQYDDLVVRAHQLGFRILATITGDAPRWATAGGRGGSFATANYLVNATEYASFAEAVARRYAGNFAGLPAIRFFSIWNEPNHKQFLKPLAAAPSIYRQLVAKGVPAIRKGGVKGVKVFVGETAPSASAGKAMGPRSFMQQWLCLNSRWKRISTGGCRNFKKVEADGYAHHPYGTPGPVSRTRDTVSIGVISRLSGYLDAAARQGRIRGHLGIYDTEFGYQSNPPDRSVGTTPTKQGQLINEKEEVHYRFGRLKSYSQYLMYDDKALSSFQTGLRFRSGKGKPAYAAYRLPIVVHGRGGGVYIWGRVRPGRGARFVQLQIGGRNYGPRIRTNSGGYFGVKRSRRGAYSFKGYIRNGSKIALVGSSRTASPI
jgi:hypothetical protein